MSEQKKYTFPPQSNHPFEVPDMYFEKSFAQIITHTEALQKLPYETPAAYFDTLAPDIEKRILPKESPFAVPDEYFAALGKSILERKNEKAPEPSLARWHWGLAAAASLVLWGTWFFFWPEKPVENQAVQFESSAVLLAAINKADVQQYLETHRGLHDEVILEVVEQKNIKLPEFGEQKASGKEKEKWKEELELQDLDDLDLEL